MGKAIMNSAMLVAAGGFLLVNACLPIIPSIFGRVMAMPNAGCFSASSVNLPLIGWTPPVCTDWRHCDKDWRVNSARGYGCSRFEDPPAPASLEKTDA